MRRPDLEERGLSASEIRAKEGALISYGTASAPLGYFLLVRKDKDLCAIKFTEFHRGDYKERTFWNAGGYSYYAEYDWFCQNDGSGDFTKPNVKSGHGKVDQRPLVGISFHLSFQTGTTYVESGPFPLKWSYPTGVAFNSAYRAESDKGIEIAPTRWQEITQINIHNARLTWFRFDSEYKRKEFIPLSELCCDLSTELRPTP